MVSILNGLSQMGTGIASFAGTAGLEAQKAQLAQQQIMLSNQLQHASKTAEIAQQGQITAGITGQEVAGRQQVAETTAAGQLGAAQTYAGGTIKAAQIQAEAQPGEVKLLHALGIPLPGLDQPGAAPAGGGPPPPPPTSRTGGGTAPGQEQTGAAGSPAGPTPPLDPLSQNIVAKALGLPMAGSDAANRMAIADDVNKDPKLKYATGGQKAAEIESRVAVAEGKMTDPASRALMAAGIASYQVPGLTGFALTKPGGPETMGLVMKLNPNYQEERYAEVNKVMSAFGSGKQGDVVRYLNVGVQHLDVFDEAAKALANGDVQALNRMDNWFEQQFGIAAPTAFNGLKQIVGTEVERAVTGGIGASQDRDRLMAALDRANSPQQLQTMTNGFRSLMTGQLQGLKTQYEDGTGFTSGPFAFENKLVPATRLALQRTSATPPAPSKATQPPSSALNPGLMAISPGAQAPSTPPSGPIPELRAIWGQ